ncbi:S26 family signal peptidase [Halorubrum sp. N11]|uniref:S26 family signal peptidase n=1 Tax=Halorubrum sp. N11 TaxID=3402276 RepID=UPI003EBF3D70
MDEGDRSDGGGESDRETESADIDTGTDDSGDDRFVDGDPTDASVGDGDDGNDDTEAFSEESIGPSVKEDTDSGVEQDTGPGVEEDIESDSEDPGGTAGRPGERSRLAGDRHASDRSETSRERVATNRTAGASDEGLLYRFRHDREGLLMWIREMLSSVAIVLVIGLILFGVSGVWPPMVAVESGSMEPNMKVGDLVFVTEPGRLAPDAADNDIGVVTHEVGEAVDYRTFGSYGSVVIYRPPGRTASPIIHRAMFHVEEGENWYDRADDRYHSAASCGDLTHCPAPHDGFITLGDNNGNYDQASGLAAPVRSDWVKGVARVRIPYLGYVRLIATGQAELGDVLATKVVVQTGSVGVGLSEIDEKVISDVNPTVSAFSRWSLRPQGATGGSE